MREVYVSPMDTNTAPLKWEPPFEDEYEAYAADGSEVAHIGPLANREDAAKWNTPYVAGRPWWVYDADHNIVAEGQAPDARAAKAAVAAAVANLA